MALIPSGIICAWPSTVASIPAGWTRETLLDTKYLQGAATGANADLTTAFGAATHIHTSPAHTPVQNSHTHTFSTASAGNSSFVTALNDATGLAAKGAHVHPNATSASGTAVNNASTITVDAASNDLSFLKVIWIKSDGTPLGFPSGAILFFESDTFPTGWTRTNGDVYLKGADAAGNGGATGGSNTHVHTSPAHTHTQNSHNHSNTNSAVTTTRSGTATGAAAQAFAHTHSVAFAGTTAVNNSVTTTINSGNGEPIFKKLNTISYAGTTDYSNMLIAIWGGTAAAIPTDWARYGPMDTFFLKGSASNGQSLTTGGATTHTHTASNCQPTQVAHTHTATSTGDNGATAAVNATATSTASNSGTNHTTWTAANQTPTNQSTAVTINANTAESAYPPYQKVIYIQYNAPLIVDVRPSSGMLLGVGL